MDHWKLVYEDSPGWVLPILDGMVEMFVFVLGLAVLVGGVVALFGTLDPQTMLAFPMAALLLHWSTSSLRVVWGDLFAKPLVVEGPARDVVDKRPPVWVRYTINTHFTVGEQSFHVPARKLSSSTMIARTVRVAYLPHTRRVTGIWVDLTPARARAALSPPRRPSAARRAARRASRG